MTLVKFEPFSSRRFGLGPLGALQHRFNRLFDEMMDVEEDTTMANWAPRVEVIEYSDNIEIIAELPGIDKKDVNVELRDNTLTISGEKQHSQERKDRNIYINERIYGSFRRSFQLPTNVDGKNIRAEFRNGLLKINIDKLEEAKPRQIAIEAD